MTVSDVIAQAEANGAIVGVSAIVAGGERFSHNGGRRFVAASTVKIAIMIELFRQIDAGTLSLDTRHTLRPADKATGSGVVANLHDGIELTLGDLAYLMMSISDNSSTNMLIDHVGQERVNATMRDLGMAGSTLGRRMRGMQAEASEQENWAVPDDYVHRHRRFAGRQRRLVRFLQQDAGAARIAAERAPDRAPSAADRPAALGLQDRQPARRHQRRWLRDDGAGAGGDGDLLREPGRPA